MLQNTSGRRPTGVRNVTPCPVCQGLLFRQGLPEQAIEREILLRNDFTLSRFGRKPAATEVKDLLDFMHGFPAPLIQCLRCGLWVRNEGTPMSAGDYHEDVNDFELMDQVYPTYVEAFRRKESGYRSLLRPGADVLEIGSHLGAFLQVAEEWNWHPFGLDVGDDTVDFMRRKGLPVEKTDLDDAFLASSSFDAVFLWNCFEQMTEPVSVLKSLRKVLRPHGLLVLRVPNAAHYFAQRKRALRGARFGYESLALNNLLGFPYLHGYTADTLNLVAKKAGYVPVRGFNSELITWPFPEERESIKREQQRVSAQTERWTRVKSRELGTLAGPWIELAYRKLEDPDSTTAPETEKLVIEAGFLPRAA